MAKILKNTFITLGIILMVVFAAAGVYFILVRQAADIDKLQRTFDIDGDGIPDLSDPDVDGDGIPNMQDPDADGDGIPNIEDALLAAEKLIGRPYDQLNEVKNSVLSQLGAIVCTDVVVFSFEKAGIYLGREMKELFKKKPKLFYGYQWNNPYDENFTRRMRNLRVYFKEKGFMLKDGAELKPGDIIMFSQGHIALIEKVEGDDFVTIESSSKKIVTMRTHKEDIIKRSTKKYGDDVAFARITFDPPLPPKSNKKR
jgi:preprotein translocase subunit YajC